MVIHSPYLMEGENESQRLAVKDNTSATYAQLIETGLSQVANPGACIVDAGTGVGVVAQQMAEIAVRDLIAPRLILLDASKERLQVAQNRLAHYACDQSFLKCELENIPLPDSSVDYLFCRFVFEYLSNPKNVFSEFMRILKPGGKLVIGDLDNNAITHYPLEDNLQWQLDCIVREIQKSGTFDFQAGRKLYSYFYQNHFTNIKVHFHAHHLIYGNIKDNDDFNWTTKLERLITLQEKGSIELDFSVAEFAENILKFFRSPGRFSYTPLILVEGLKGEPK
jgi:ubiquinone/menaquinone biosynthesis C-methylase UbiE